jgi:hypothetical protein
MPVLRVLLVILALAFVPSSLAQEYWDPAQCLETMIDHIEHLEEDVADIEDLLVRIAEAEAKGETERATNFRTVLHSKRVDGIQSMLRRIDTVEYVYCDKSKFDPSLIASVDAARPYAEETEATVAAVEEPPKISVNGISTTFVPYEMLEGGGCKGPFLDLSINLINSGGAYPHPVDVERRQREYPNVDWTTRPFLTVTVLIDWGEGEGQEVIELPWSSFRGGTFEPGATMTVPYRLFVPSNEKSVRVGGWVTGATFLVVDGTSYQSAPYRTEASIPIWDVYTESAAVLTRYPNVLPPRKDIIELVVKAVVVNRGQSPIPGWVGGNFTMRHQPGGRIIGTVSGSTLFPFETSPAVLGQSTARELLKDKVFVDSSVHLLCPDGSAGTLSDGNTENNIRSLLGNE